MAMTNSVVVERRILALVGNDPVLARGALEGLASSKRSVVESMADVLKNRSGTLIESYSAIFHLAKLYGHFGTNGVESLVDCIRSGTWNTKLVAAHCFRHVTDASARSTAQTAVGKLLADDKKDVVKAAIVALGELGAVLAANDVVDVARRDEEGSYDLYALESLLRLIAADSTDTFLGMRFHDFNELFEQSKYKPQALSWLHFTLPEWKNRVRDSVVDLIVSNWLNSEDRHLWRLGSDALGILRVRRVRPKLAARIQELVEHNHNQDDDSIMRLAVAWGCIGATDEESIDILRRFYESSNDALCQCARFALSFSFPELMATPPANMPDAFCDRFVNDSLELYDSEMMAYVLVGLGRRRMTPKIKRKLSSSNPLVRAAAALALARSERRGSDGTLTSFAADAHTSSFERLIALSAMTRHDPMAAEELHKALCTVPPCDLWHMRHGIAPPGPSILNPYFWTREIIYALDSDPTSGHERAMDWADVLLLNAENCIAECKRFERPRVFISYSCESKQHREWVAQFAARLETDAIDTTLDQKDVGLGEHFGHFMERAVHENDFVLCICTPRYKARFDSRRGGVGTEAQLMVPLFESNESKFIPILREGSWDTATPRYFNGKRGLDMTGRRFRVEEYDTLLTHLNHQN
jgi:hypothetical protein